MIDSLPILESQVDFPGRLARWFRRRAKRRSLIRQELWLEDPHCRYCRRPLPGPWAGVLDHAVPRSRGGSDGRQNAVLACRRCDGAKGDWTIDEWQAALVSGLFATRWPQRFLTAHPTEAGETVEMIRTTAAELNEELLDPKDAREHRPA